MGGEELLGLVSDRRRFLTYLKDDTAYKRDIVDDLNVSRSTVDRVISKLTNEHLVQRSKTGYKITNKGEISLNTVSTTLETLNTLERATEILQWLPEDVDIPQSIFEHGEVYLGEQPAPLSPTDRGITRLENCDKIVSLSHSDSHPQFAEVFMERVYDEQFVAEMTVRESLMEWLVSIYEGHLEYLLESGSLNFWVSENVSFGLLIYYMFNDTFVHLIPHGSRGEYRGHIETSNAEVVEWAENYITKVQEESQSFQDFLISNH
jgi:predicted transcriptional regulator